MLCSYNSSYVTVFEPKSRPKLINPAVCVPKGLDSISATKRSRH